MKTLEHIVELQNTAGTLFGTKYDFFIARLGNDYISKSDGIDRIQYVLEDWDKDSRRLIVQDLIEYLSASGLEYFNRAELRRLI